MASSQRTDIGPPGVVGGPASGPWRRVRVFAVLLPVAFIVLLQFLRPLVSPDPLPDAGEAILHTLTIVAAVCFGLAMVRLIDRWNAALVASNRELAVRDAVSSALRDADGGAGDVAVTAARAVRTATGALDVALELDGAPGAPAQHWDAEGEADGAAATRAADVRDVQWDAADVLTSTLTVPLLAAATRVGTMTLTMPVRERLSESADGAVDRRIDALGPATIAAVGQQIGSALHRAQLRADLERSLRDQRAVSDVLIDVASGMSLETGLLSVVRAARELTDARDAGLTLAPGAAPAPGPTPGGVCVTDAVRQCPIGSTGPTGCAHRPRDGRLVTVPVRGPRGTLGELWVDGCGSIADRRTVLRDLAELASVAVEHARLLEDERGAAAVREREWIAREMHDSLAQVLGVLHLRLRSLEALVGAAEPRETALELADLADIAHDAFVDVREAILGLRTASPGDRSFLEALRGYAAKYERQCGVRVEVDANGAIDLAPATEVQVLRVVQEALTNVRKHAQARHARVELRREGPLVAVTIADDGAGFAPGASRRFDTFGLSSMRERSELVGGTLTIDSAPGRGTTVTARVPAAGAGPAEPLRTASASLTRPAPRGDRP